MTQTLYERVGGRATFERLVHLFYVGVAGDDLLRPMYPDDDLPGAEDRLRMFLEQYWGGPTDYSQTRGHPRLRMRHQPFPITPEARDRWLHHMLGALDQLDLETEADEAIRDHLVRAAHSLVNIHTTDPGRSLPLL
ncbi:globin [Aestuariimicrobium ganziense]|uniref:globin n=1 Tax=Aestuariimicrobium ganziense TaxID=2773677 RepID=UPI001945522F|nr:globin [Aestuariimicrobium ganziense]